MVLKQSNVRTSQIKKGNNKILPIDVMKFNENNNIRNSIKFVQDKENEVPKRMLKSNEKSKEVKKGENQKQSEETKNRLFISRMSRQSNV